MSEDHPFAVGVIPDRWESGVAALSQDAEYCYFRLCLRMWATGQGVHRDDAHAACRFHPKFKTAVEVLLRAGKVRIEGDSYVNDRALEEYARAVERQEANRRRGKRGGRPQSFPSDSPVTPQSPPPVTQTHPDPYPLENTTEPSISTEARPLTRERAREDGAPAAADDAGRVVQAFDAAGKRHFGPSWRAWPGQRDHGTARAMLEAGADPALCAAVFDALLMGMAAKRQPPPRTLAYARDAVSDALASAKQGLPPARQHPPPGETLAERARRIADATERRMAGGRT